MWVWPIIITMKITVEKKVDSKFVGVELTEGKETEVFKDSKGNKKILLGVGPRKDITLRKLHLLPRQVVAEAKKHKIKKLAVNFSDFKFKQIKLSDEELAQILAIGFEMANYEFVKYKSKPKEGWNFVEEIVVVGGNEKGIKRGQIIAEEVNKTRTLCNTPGGEMTPKLLAAAAIAAAKSSGAGPGKIKVRILDEKQIKKLGMGGVVGVSKGSAERPKFIIVEYWGGSKKERPVVLVGKGVTFDTGGLNLKPEQGIYEMHMDMSGGAAVIHTVALAAKLKIKKNIVALVPAVENMPSGSAYHPGDVLRTMSGKTIEVLNTDAEGRVILADALCYAKKYNPAIVIDVATLTGAVMSALGQRASGIFTRDLKLESRLRELGETSGDYVWPLPLWDEYESEIKGTFGDFANVGKTRYGGAITGAIFLYQFTKDYPRDTKWVHIDIASRMTAVEGEFLAKGAAGAPVCLLINFLDKN